MKKHIEAIKAIQADVSGKTDPHSIADAVGALAGAVAEALADLPGCTDCGSKQGGALKTVRKPATKKVA